MPLVHSHCDAQVERPDGLGHAPLQLGSQQAAQDLVIAIPLLVPVQGNDQEVSARQIIEDARRPGDAQDRVAERATHPIEHRGPDEEGNLGRGRPIEQLDTEIVGHVRLVAGLGESGVPMRRPGPDGER